MSYSDESLELGAELHTKLGTLQTTTMSAAPALEKSPADSTLLLLQVDEILKVLKPVMSTGQLKKLIPELLRALEMGMERREK